MHTLKSLFTHATIGITKVDLVIAMRQLNLFAFVVANGGKSEVSVVNHGKDTTWATGNFAGSSKDCFNLRRAYMRTLPIQIIQLLLIQVQFGRCVQKSIELVLRQGQNFRLNERGDGRGTH